MNPTPGSPSSVPSADVDRPAEPEVSLDLENLVPGARWRGVYQIGEQQSDVTYGKVFKALHVGTLNDVVIRTFRVSDGLRARSWNQIRKAQNGALVDPIEAFEANGRRVEVVQAPPTVTLREWSGRRKVTPVEIALILRQLSQAVGGLHREGVVHLNLRPDTIFVRSSEGGLNVYLGGFELATLYREAGQVEVSMDPYYAPPEAHGLYHYAREPGLRAWDWWTVGRIVQELVLGRHILGHLLERDVSRETPELRARAENLLSEQNHAMRAGAVEAMPAMDREMTTLLRGLLTSARDGRWGLADVECWLRKEPVKERYSLGRHERLFVWKDRSYTVPEAAEHFCKAENWADAITNLFEPTNPETLASFIATAPEHAKTKVRFEMLVKLGESTGLHELPPAIVTDVVVAVTLKFLVGNHAPLIMRGRRIDEAHLKALLAPEAQPAGLATVYALCARPVVQQIEQFDVEVARLLGELERIYDGAAALARSNKWLPVNDATELARLMSLCLEPDSLLNAVRTEMLKAYACSRDRVLDKLFKKKDASRVELVVIAFTQREPVKYGYATHREWNEEQYRLLYARGEQLSAAVTWLQLGHAIKMAPLIFGRWRLCVPAWFLISAAVVVIGQNLPALIIASSSVVAVGVVRVLWFGFHRAKLHHRFPSTKSWGWRSGWARCRAEALAVLQAESAPGPRALQKALREINEEISRLTLEPAPKPAPTPLRFSDTWMVVYASWILMALLVGGTVWWGVRHPPSLAKIKTEWLDRLSFFSQSSEDESPAVEKPRLMETGKAPAMSIKSFETMLDELRRAKAEAEKQGEVVKVGWPFKVPLRAQVVRVREMTAAVKEQVSVAEEMAELLLDRYTPETVDAMIAVRVPTESGVGLMLYDGRSRKLVDRNVFTIGFVPLARSWLEVDSKKALYLGGL